MSRHRRYNKYRRNRYRKPKKSKLKKYLKIWLVLFIISAGVLAYFVPEYRSNMGNSILWTAIITALISYLPFEKRKERSRNVEEPSREDNREMAEDWGEGIERGKDRYYHPLGHNPFGSGLAGAIRHHSKRHRRR